MNTRTFLLIAGLTALFGVVGLAIGGEGGMFTALGIALAMNMFAYWNSDKIVLAMYRAKPVSDKDSPELLSIIKKLAKDAEIPTPKAYIIDNNQPNAFATGRNPEHGAVALTTGLLRMLDEREIAGVLAHELMHIKNRDTLTMTITATIAGAIGMLANFAFFFGGSRDRNMGPIAIILMAILAPIAAMLVQMAISRTREYDADHGGAKISNDPMGLALALAKISKKAELTTNIAAERNPATAHMFIINPLHKRGLDNLFSTHPNTEKRIEKLKQMDKEVKFKGRKL
ncbi:zinc metalloprotease HtpX [Rickettsiales bacterium]|nr:zinc metalloprotease HtpX [Rickettsiales bacterium]